MRRCTSTDILERSKRIHLLLGRQRLSCLPNFLDALSPLMAPDTVFLLKPEQPIAEPTLYECFVWNQ